MESLIFMNGLYYNVMLAAPNWRWLICCGHRPRGVATRQSETYIIGNVSATRELDFKGFYDYANGNGGTAIAASISAEAILEATAPRATFFNFTFRPIVPTDKSPAIIEKAIAWRDSIR
jgi:hypothetical protein